MGKKNRCARSVRVRWVRKKLDCVGLVWASAGVARYLWRRVLSFGAACAVSFHDAVFQQGVVCKVDIGPWIVCGVVGVRFCGEDAQALFDLAALSQIAGLLVTP